MKFPLIGLVENDDMIYVIEDPKVLTSTSEEIFNQGVLPNEKYIDSEGYIYKVKSIQKIGNAALWGWNPLLKGKQIKIKTEYFPATERMELDQFKTTIITRVNKKKKFWESAWDISELIEKIDNAKSFKEIIKFLK